MKCRFCNNPELLRLHQVGVINSLKIEGESEPEVLFDILLCQLCGNITADPETITIKTVEGQWNDFKLMELKKDG
jgi:hypothetical protein